MANPFKVGDTFRIHGHVSAYASGDTIDPRDYEYTIENIDADANGSLNYIKQIYTPEVVFNVNDIYKSS